MIDTVWITRHGNRQDFVDPEWSSSAERIHDPPLSSDGEVQAGELAVRLRNEGIRHVFSSPFLRCIQTANRVAEELDLEIKLEWGLGEWLNPAWFPTHPETVPLEVLKELYPRIDGSYVSRFELSYPETDENMLQRSGETVDYLIQECDGEFLMVGHGASVVGAATRLLDQSTRVGEHRFLAPRIPYCCLVKMIRQDNGWQMELNGDTSHLSEADDGRRYV